MLGDKGIEGGGVREWDIGDVEEEGFVSADL